MKKILLFCLFIVFGLQQNSLLAEKSTRDQFVKAARTGDLKTVQNLFEMINWYDVNDAIYLATENGHLKIVGPLVDMAHEREIDITEGINDAIYLAARKKQLEVVKFLADVPNEIGIDITGGINSAITIEVVKGDLKMVGLLVDMADERRIDITVGINDAISWAAEKGNLEIVSFLVDVAHERCINEAIESMAKSGHLEVVMLLLDVACKRGIDITRGINRAIHWAAVEDYFEIVKFLVDMAHERRTDITRGINSAICWAAINGHLEMVMFLAERGADTNSTNWRYCTPLMLAAENEHIHIIQFLLIYGADTELKNNEEKTATDVAREQGLIGPKQHILVLATLYSDFYIFCKREEFTDEEIHVIDLKEAIKNGLPRLRNYLTELYNSRNETGDFTIIVEGEKIKVHKFILQARSDLFRGMFLSAQEDRSNQVNDYSRRSAETIKVLIWFLYTGKLNLSGYDRGIKQTILEELEEAVEYYQLNQNSELPGLIKREIKKMKYAGEWTEEKEEPEEEIKENLLR